MSELTAEQREVAEAGPGERLLVTAGPGTGKTHTLISRIGHLVDLHDVNPGGILTLSYSRAAVGELRRRLRATGDDAGRVTPVTFDSFATRLLSQVDPDGAWTQESYDGRIDAAIGQMDGIGELLETIQHVFVDELQDLVGVRMRFVRALLDHLDVGFTLLGDPAQGIYDFALADGETPENDGAPALYEWVRSRYEGHLVDRPLTVNHRAKSELAKRAAALGPLVISAREGAMPELKGVLADAPRLPSLGVLRNSSAGQRTAVLCRNNGQALWTSRHLRSEEIDHVLQRDATNRSVAPWVARLVMATGGGELSKGRFGRELEKAGDGVEAEEVWGPLRRVARTDNGIDLDRLVERMRNGVIPDELHVARGAPIVVSTVHRAKGLEFDRVVIIDGGWDEPFDDEDARTLFVAESRAIETIATAELPEVHGRLLKDDWTDRWTHAGWERWKRYGVEVRPDDVEATEPAGAHMLNADATQIQELLAEQVKPGDHVSFEFIRARIGEPGAIYQIVWNDRPIGLVSRQFGADLMRVLKAARSWSYPQRIGELSVDAIRSVGGNEMASNQAGLGPGGAWLVPSVVGLGSFEWGDRS